MPVVITDIYGIRWQDPMDITSRKIYDPFNHYLFEEYQPDRYPQNWKSVQRGVIIYAPPNQLIELEDESDKFDGTNKYFRTEHYPIVSNVDSLTTTLIAQIEVKINNVLVNPTSLDGENGIIYLSTPPVSGSAVTCTYRYPTPVYAMADGEVQSVGGGYVCIKHSDDSKKYIITTVSTYILPLVTDGETIKRGSLIGYLKHRGIQSALYLECYSNTVNAPSPSSRWGNEGAKELANDIYLVNPEILVGTAYAPDTRYKPEITSIVPSSGPVAGGTYVTVNGRNFQDNLTIEFGDNFFGINTSYISPILFYTTTPPHTSGLVDVIVTNPDDLFTISSGGYRYDEPPYFDPSGAIVPNQGTTLGGTIVSIYGGFFRYSSLVYFGTNVVSSSGFQFISDNILRVQTPPHAEGPVDVKVYNSPDEECILPSGYTYVPPPSASYTSPSSGYEEGGTIVTVYGTDFLTGGRVLFDSLPALSTQFIDENTLIVTTPPHLSGYVDVEVENPDKQTSIITSGYYYTSMVGFPFIKLITPKLFPNTLYPVKLYPSLNTKPSTVINSDFDNYSLGPLGGQGPWENDLVSSPWLVDSTLESLGVTGYSVKVSNSLSEERVYSDYDNFVSTVVTVKFEYYISNPAVPSDPLTQGLMVGIGKSDGITAEWTMVNRSGIYYRADDNDYTPIFYDEKYISNSLLNHWNKVEIRYDFSGGVILGILNAPPGSPTVGDRYLVGSSPTGAWAGYADHIATYSPKYWAYYPWIPIISVMNDPPALPNTNDRYKVGSHPSGVWIGQIGMAATWTGLSWTFTTIPTTLNVPPVSPNVYDRYLIGTNPDGDWVGHNMELTIYQDNYWRFEDATPEQVYNGTHDLYVNGVCRESFILNTTNITDGIDRIIIGTPAPLDAGVKIYMRNLQVVRPRVY